MKSKIFSVAFLSALVLFCCLGVDSKALAEGIGVTNITSFSGYYGVGNMMNGSVLKFDLYSYGDGTLNLPNGDTAMTVTPGKTYELSWGSINFDPNMSIFIYDKTAKSQYLLASNQGGVFEDTWMAFTNYTGSYNWTFPTTLPSGSNYQICVSPISGGLHFDPNVSTPVASVPQGTYDGTNLCLNIAVINLIKTTSITINNNNSTVIGATQMSVAVQPAGADKSAVWSVSNGTGSATISSTGLLTPTKSGTVTVTASTADGSGLTASANFTVSVVSVSNITVSSANSAITAASGKTLQISAAVLPANATNPSVTWSVANGTGSATISSSGLLTAGNVGTVTVKATAADGSGTVGTLPITIIVPATGLSLSTPNYTTTVTNGKTLQITANISPASANQNANWSVSNDNGSAKISSTGLLTATSPGSITVTATTADGSNISKSMPIYIIACYSIWQAGPWSACSTSGNQTRTVTDANNCGTTSGQPATSQNCTFVAPVPACTDSNWTSTLSPAICPSYKTQTKFWTKKGTCSGGITHLAVETVSCVYQASICTNFIYSAWAPCTSSNNQTRTVMSSLPAGCQAGTPVLSQTCTYVAPTNPCTSDNWVLSSPTPAVCPPAGQQTETYTKTGNCTGGVSQPASVTIPCSYIAPVAGCTSTQTVSVSFGSFNAPWGWQSNTCAQNPVAIKTGLVAGETLTVSNISGSLCPRLSPRSGACVSSTSQGCLDNGASNLITLASTNFDKFVKIGFYSGKNLIKEYPLSQLQNAVVVPAGATSAYAYFEDGTANDNSYNDNNGAFKLTFSATVGNCEASATAGLNAQKANIASVLNAIKEIKTLLGY